MSPKKKYVAVYERDRDADAWNVASRASRATTPTDARLRQAQARIREALALWLDRELEGLAIEDRLAASVSSVATQVARARQAAEAAGEKVQQQASEALKRFTDLGLSGRDAAEVLGVSHQRAQQLIDANRPNAGEQPAIGAVGLSAGVLGTDLAIRRTDPCPKHGRSWAAHTRRYTRPHAACDLLIGAGDMSAEASRRRCAVVGRSPPIWDYGADAVPSRPGPGGAAPIEAHSGVIRGLALPVEQREW